MNVWIFSIRHTNGSNSLRSITVRNHSRINSHEDGSLVLFCGDGWADDEVNFQARPPKHDE